MTATQDADTEKNKTIVQRYVDEMQNAHSLENIERYSRRILPITWQAAVTYLSAEWMG
jgi:hypothetical protein